MAHLDAVSSVLCRYPVSGNFSQATSLVQPTCSRYKAGQETLANVETNHQVYCNCPLIISAYVCWIWTMDMDITFKCNVFAEEETPMIGKRFGIHLFRWLVHRVPSVLNLLNYTKNKSGNEMNKLPESGPPSASHIYCYLHLTRIPFIGLLCYYATSGPMANATQFCAVNLHTKFSSHKSEDISFRFNKRKEFRAKFSDSGSISSKKKIILLLISSIFSKWKQADCLEERFLPQQSHQASRQRSSFNTSEVNRKKVKNKRYFSLHIAKRSIPWTSCMSACVHRANQTRVKA